MLRRAVDSVETKILLDLKARVQKHLLFLSFCHALMQKVTYLENGKRMT